MECPGHRRPGTQYAASGAAWTARIILAFDTRYAGEPDCCGFIGFSSLQQRGPGKQARPVRVSSTTDAWPYREAQGNSLACRDTGTASAASLITEPASPVKILHQCADLDNPGP